MRVSAALFAVSAPACWALAQRLPFNGLELVWNPLQLAWLAGIFLLLSLPFFFAACCFGLAFMHARERIAVLYAADLIGAGLGAGIATGLLFLCRWKRRFAPPPSRAQWPPRSLPHPGSRAWLCRQRR